MRLDYRFAVLAILLLFGNCLTARDMLGQSVNEQRQIDSIMLALPSLPLPSRFQPASMKQCERFSPQLEHTCKGLIWSGAGGFVPMGDHQSILPGAILSSTDTLVYCVTKIRPGDAAAAGRSEFWFASQNPSVWGSTYYGRALIELDSKHHFDSTLVLLGLASKAGGVAAGVLDLTAARALYQKGDGSGAWRLLVKAAGDTSAVAQGLLRSTLFRLMPLYWQHAWDSVDTKMRSLWLSKATALKTLIAQGMKPVFLDKCLDARFKEYAERRDSSIVIIPFALEGGTLVADTISKRPLRSEYRYRVHIEAVREEDGLAVIYDSAQAVPLAEAISVVASTIVTSKDPRPLPNGGFEIPMNITYTHPDKAYRLVSSVELALRPGHYTITAVISQDGARRGITKFLPSIDVPTISAIGLSATDLILGVSSNGIPWHAPSGPVLLNPYGEWHPSDLLTLYTQLHGIVPDSNVQVALHLYRFKEKSAEAKPTLTVEFQDHSRTTVMDWSRQLKLDQVAKGQYCVVLDFAQGTQRAKAVDRLVITPYAGLLAGDDEYRLARRDAESPGLAAACAALRS